MYSRAFRESLARLKNEIFIWLIAYEMVRIRDASLRVC